MKEYFLLLTRPKSWGGATISPGPFTPQLRNLSVGPPGCRNFAKLIICIQKNTIIQNILMKHFFISNSAKNLGGSFPLVPLALEVENLPKTNTLSSVDFTLKYIAPYKVQIFLVPIFNWLKQIEAAKLQGAMNFFSICCPHFEGWLAKYCTHK